MTSCYVIRKMDLRLYVLLFNMRDPMCIYYVKSYKTWVNKNNIKIGHTVDWEGSRKGVYEKNYGSSSIVNHKNPPYCDGCGKNCDGEADIHHHVKIYKTWKFDPIKRNEISIQKEMFTIFGNSITENIKNKFQNLPRTEYFFLKDLDMIINEMNSIINEKNTQIYSVTIE